MIHALNNAFIFLLSTIVDLYVFILLTRFILVWIRVDYFNPITQFVAKLSRPLIQPLKRVMPTVKNIEFSTLLVIFTLVALKFFLIGLATIGLPDFFGLFLLTCADILKSFVNFFFYAVLLQVILSWVPHFSYSPAYRLLALITAPLIYPVKRIIPPVAGFDITPIPVLMGLHLLLILLVNPLYATGMNIAFR